MSFDIYWYLAFASQIDDVDVKLNRVQTDNHTHKTSTVTLAAHARRGLIIMQILARASSPYSTVHARRTRGQLLLPSMADNHESIES